MTQPAGQRPPGKALPDPASLLARASLFSSCPREELATLAARSGLVAFADGESVFEAEDPARKLWLVAAGSVEIRSPEDGSVLAEYVEGDSFGELEFLTRTRRSAAARAKGDCLLLGFPAGEAGLDDAFAGDPALAARLYRSFLLVVAGRTRKANALVKENSPWVRELGRQVHGDKLTGLLNKAWLEERLPGMLVPPLALLMLKPDNFKEINDRFGHEVGDAALVLLAAELERAVGKAGTALRYMGNELAVVLPGTDRAGALAAAGAIQARLSALDLSALTREPDLRLSISLGIGLYPEHGTDAPALVAAVSGLPLAARSRGGSLILFPGELP